MPGSPCLELPYDLLAYEHWLREHGGGRTTESYLFLEPRVRFLPEPDDALVLVPEVTLERAGNHLILCHRPSKTRTSITNLDAAVAERIVGSIDGQRCLLAVQVAARVTEAEMDAFLRATFGRFTLCPKTVEVFEQRLAAYSLVRFPGSPYEVGRYYWSNMAAVREAWRRERTSIVDGAALAAALKRYHVLALIGETGRSFYRPSSPIVSRSGARAGAFYDVGTRTLRDLDLTLFIDGPRVSAPFVGGREYHELVYRSVGDAGALDAERGIVDDSGLDWGRVTFGRSRGDREPDAWFIPPRPLTHRHFEQLYDRYARAFTLGEPATDAALDALAGLHWCFVRLHPFTCANQSLAMNVVGGLLELQGSAGMPHLLLDHLALRLNREAYAELFRRAFRAWSGPESSSLTERQRLLAHKRSQMDGLVSFIGQTKSLDEARRRIADSPEAARLALLTA